MSNVASLVQQKHARFLNEITKAGVDPQDSAVKEQYEDFKLNVTRQALKVLKELIPAKIVYFNNLMNVNSGMGDLLHDRDLDFGERLDFTEPKCEENGAPLKKRALSSSDVINNSENPFPINNQILKLKSRICRDALDLIEMVGTVRLWIQLNVPRIEDGNNFGVAIQEEAILELRRVEDSAFNLCDGIVYYASRAKLVSKHLKYPNVHDYIQSIREVDRKEWINLKFSTLEMRNNYSMLYELLHKNWEKVVKPRAADSNRMVM